MPVNPYLSGGIRPLNLTDQQIDDLVAFMESLTSPAYVRRKDEISNTAINAAWPRKREAAREDST